MLILAQEIPTDRERLIATAALVAAAILLYWLALAAGKRYVARMTGKGEERGARASTLWTVIRRLVLIGVVLVVILFVFTLWGWSIAPFIAVGTVLAAAVGFGAQHVVRDFLTGFFILVEDQFHVGDTVTIAGTTGRVEDMQLRITVLRDQEGNVHFVPNGQITVTSNFTSKYAQPVIDVKIAYQADVDRAMAILQDELLQLAADPEFGQLILEPPEVLGVTELTDSGVIVSGRIKTVANSRWKVRREALRRIQIRFGAEGISISSSA